MEMKQVYLSSRSHSVFWITFTKDEATKFSVAVKID